MVVFMHCFNVSDCQKTVSKTKCYPSTTIERPTNLSTVTSTQRITVSIFFLILDEYKIMIEMQKLEFMQEFTSAIIVECLHSSLQAKLQMPNCACIKHAKTCFKSI